jgi:plasmid stability protein
MHYALEPAMAILQIRDLPDDLYAELRREAERSHRSIAQQAIVELRKAQGLDVSARHATIERLRRATPILPMRTKGVPAPEVLIREDRDR